MAKRRGTRAGWTRRDFLKGAAASGGGAWLLGRAPAVLAASSGPVKLGVLLPYSKVYAVLGEHITNAMELYFEGVQWTAGGRKIEWTKEDEELEPAVGLRKARKLIESDQVDLLAGVVSTATAYAIRDLIHTSRTLFVCANAGGNDLTRGRKSPYIFRTSFTSWQISHPMGEWVAKNVAKNVYVSAADYAFGRESVSAFKESFLPAGGKIVGETFPPLGNTDYGPYLTQIAQAKPEATYSFYSGSDAVRFVKQYGEYGLKKTVALTGTGFMVEEDVLPAQGEAALGTYSSLHWALTMDTPENKRFVAAYRERFKKDPSVFSVQGYDTARVIVEALNRTGGDTSNKQKLIEAIAGVKFASPRGPFEFDPQTHSVVQNVYIRQVKEVGGKAHNVVLATLKGIRDPGQ